MVPSLENAGRSLPSVSVVVSARMPSSVLNSSGSPLRCGMETGDDLVVEEAVLPGPRGELVAAGAELVLLLAGELLVAGVGLLGEQPHRLVGEGVPEAVEGHVVAHRHVAVLEALAGLLEQVRRVGHRLLAAGDDDVELAGADQLVGHARWR